MLRKVIYLISNRCFLTGYTQVSSSFSLYPPTHRIKDANWARRGRLTAMLLSTQLAYHGGLWCHPYISYGTRSFKDNKTRLPKGRVNTLQHTLVPQSSIGSVESLNLDQAQEGTTTHTALWNGEKGGQLHGGSQDATSQTSAACCMTRVGTEWELVCCLLSVCVFVIMTEYFWARVFEERPFFSFFLPVFRAARTLLSLLFVSVATGISHASSFF